MLVDIIKYDFDLNKWAISNVTPVSIHTIQGFKIALIFMYNDSITRPFGYFAYELSTGVEITNLTSGIGNETIEDALIETDSIIKMFG